MNTSLLSNITNFQQLANYTNNATDGLLLGGGLMVFFVIIVYAIMRFDDRLEVGLAIGGWSMFIVSTFFWFAKLVPTVFPLAFLAIAVVVSFILYVSK